MSNCVNWSHERIAVGEDGTAASGREVAALTRPGDLWLVSGEVGAGKSTLVRAALRELGVTGAIPSPTFTIGRLYELPGQAFPAAHLDLYRLGDLAGEDPGLLVEYFGPDRASFVEWPGGAEEDLKEMATRTGRVAIDHIDEGSRRIRIQPPS